MGDARSKDRLRRNEEMFRQVNERLGQLADAFAEATGAEAATFVCECSRADCIEQLVLPLDEYRRIRANADCFFVVPGHEVPEIEHVVARGDRYLVVSSVA